MDKLRNVLEKAQNNGTALGHFNISDWILLKAVFESAQELRVPVIVGASEGERAFLGVRQSRPWSRACARKRGSPSF